MKQVIKKILYQVTEDVLGKLAFMFTFPEDERELIENDSVLTASVSFEGMYKGALVMTISDHVLPELTGNMLGIEEDETSTSEQQHDALKELINVICGNLLPEIAGKEAIFKVGMPQIFFNQQAPSFSDLTPVSSAKLAIEDGECDIHLYIQGELSPDIISQNNESESHTQDDF
ncbi:Chemotaxis phosphatase CheX-like domain-containing protein [Desulfonema limicola]|uniref:Chemotaxis phosphatase CheX-like domain-containing protein n=1 Tax=Desulfonema limicola TaxID=45656 RepID=A0A975BAN6_9BACT|nr:chemotaxis protein CheX [Desulfonema limicola]QTA81680.1 Chemotaxis phosphatase CheX-like domain-containing protein [Desulfonema limicola]